MDKKIIGVAILGVAGLLIILDGMELGLNIPMDITTIILIPIGLLFVGVI